MPLPFSNVFDLLDELRTRPGLYIGHQSPTHLHSFLSGAFLASNLSTIKDGEPDFNYFHDWVANKLNYSESTSGWAYMIEDQREDKTEALCLFFELLDEFRGLTHETLASIDYLSRYKLDTSWRGYSRLIKVRGTFEESPKPRPSKLMIRKMATAEKWYSLLAFNKKSEVMDVRSSQSLDDIYKRGLDIYGVKRIEWNQAT